MRDVKNGRRVKLGPLYSVIFKQCPFDFVYFVLKVYYFSFEESGMLGSHLGACLLNTHKKCEFALDFTVERAVGLGFDSYGSL